MSPNIFSDNLSHQAYRSQIFRRVVLSNAVSEMNYNFVWFCLWFVAQQMGKRKLCV